MPGLHLVTSQSSQTMASNQLENPSNANKQHPTRIAKQHLMSSALI